MDGFPESFPAVPAPVFPLLFQSRGINARKKYISTDAVYPFTVSYEK